MAVPLFDTETPLAPLKPMILERLAEVVAEGQFVLGPEVQAFEGEFESYLGVRHVVGVGNGTAAITITLRPLGVTPKEEVPLSSFTFYPTAEAVADTGATP